MAGMQKVTAGRARSRSSARHVACGWHEGIYGVVWYFCNESPKAQCSPEWGGTLGVDWHILKVASLQMARR